MTEVDHPVSEPSAEKTSSAPPDYQSTAPGASSLGQQASHGFVWLLSQTLLTKLISAAGQVVIAWLLVPQEMGLVMTAYTISGFVGIMQQTGLKDILVSRHAHFRRWANAAFWISMTSGIIAMFAQWGIAPFVGHFYHKLTPAEVHRLAGLLIVLGFTGPIGALTVVPMAQLSNDLRFRAGALYAASNTIGVLVLSVILAAPPFRLGAYALLLPRPIINGLQAVWLWRDTKPPIKFKLQLRRWRYLMADSSWNVLIWFFGYIVQLGDYLTLGLMHTSTIGGLYYFAYNLSLQTMQAFTINLWGVLLPALSKLQGDRVRQTAAFMRAVRLLAILVVPLCMLQVAAADPGMHILFNPKWYPSIPVLQILSVGMAMQSVTVTINSLLMAQRRFKLLMKLQALSAALFISMVSTGSFFGNDTPPRTADITVAIAVAAFFLVFGPIFVYTAIRDGGGTWRNIVDALLPPFVAGGAGTAAALAVIHWIPGVPFGQWLRLAASIIVLGAVYVPIILLLAPQGCSDLKSRFGDLFSRLRNRFSKPA